jgi:DNA adenine methylase
MNFIEDYSAHVSIHPFVKWAGGKGQLLKEIQKIYSAGFGTQWTKYAEPFVGGGAVLFDVLKRYRLEAVYISDTNRELVFTYNVIRDSVQDFIKELQSLQEEYLLMPAEVKRPYYYVQRRQFNILKLKSELTSSEIIKCASLFIFLNKTCFNGLYRVNKKGEYNVSMGAYNNPLICDSKNLFAVSEKLKDVQIICGDYKQSRSFIDNKTFVYFDPPYRPLSPTSNFTSYTQNGFNDTQQKELAAFAKEMSDLGALIIASNSNDRFFDDLYNTFCVKRVSATRALSCDSSTRGRIKELLITNFLLR